MIVTEGYFETLMNAAITCEGILSGDKGAFEVLLDQGDLRKIVGDWRGPHRGMVNSKPALVTHEDRERFSHELETTFFMIASFAKEDDLTPPLLSRAAALQGRIAVAVETGETLDLTDDETSAAGRVLEFVTRMKLGQLERITDAFRDAHTTKIDKQISALNATELLVLRLKNALGYANTGSLNLRLAGQREAWSLVERIKSNPEILISPCETIELAS
ncbi:hypothetical protein [Roseibium sp. RKSG952]|uniref:hypothetical protein n=1 Tax=Roseibium sp. RKSG952 TaxID=2529384 RepID=UPI0012BBECC7|nr:hypothetical protein [Roseibium sp. RKSG952]MTH94976.1 hypothetical protein [Roseibium sp. RKSG952]